MDTLTTPSATAVAEAAALAYDQTVPRGMVHRWALSEVFLTDSHGVDETRFASAAQLPQSHAYYGDHPDPRWYDTLLVLESCRQAVTHAAHAYQGAPASTTFMVTSWWLELTDPDALARGERPGQLRIDGDVTRRQARGGRLRRVAFTMDLTLDGSPLGRLGMDVSCTPTDQYHRLRAMQRGGAVPTAFTLGAEPAGEPLDAALAGRRDPVNVVLDGVRRAGDGLEAELSPRSFRNRSMYDHPYDHVPAMVFSEAARQSALLLAGPGSAPKRAVSLRGDFRKFAELDQPVHLTTRPVDGADSPTWRTAAVQQDAVVAEVTVSLG
ncbi:ScbA/BarX family gamma-butyrolactone biosynthesis protein [Actinorugispora endophytica]|uniref:A-factor biosynthesis hotdog protein n=1 Tax=Actinorugispora endophytica TaxID=1605990 RepID=A0A4V3D7M3_9ACTN|nr:ScbA/BarX family gamma-butyrolactone biosynthesis protein [Actinorugispora endophytica]TDQ48467.1 A-factor biosynthesis hotdog protein [Actinorugispora endophytica]